MTELDARSVTDADGIAALQADRLREMLGEVLGSNRFYRSKLGEFGADAPLSSLPFTTREELEADQCAHPPYGTNLTYELPRYVRHHQTSGSSGAPMHWLDTCESWEWWLGCWFEIFAGAGLTREDRFFIPFSFGPFIGFWGAFDAACALGSFVLPAGGMTTPARVRYALDHGATVVCCTPTYALHMIEVAEREGVDLAGSAVRALIVAGEPGGSIPATRERIEAGWGARVFDHAGMTEMGPWGFQCEASAEDMHVIETAFIAEVVDQNGEAAADGEQGELVLTNLGRWGSPLIRYRTGDQVRLVRGRCACGRWFARVPGGILGRVDDMIVVRGNNVFPSAIEGVIRSFPEVAEFRMTVIDRPALSELEVEIEPVPHVGGDGDATALTGRVQVALQDRFHFRSRVRAVASGALPRFELKARRFSRRSEA